MHWVRSYPCDEERKQLSNRTYVEDPTTERIITQSYDYSPLGAIDDDVLLIEWDIAATQGEMEQFAYEASFRPHEVRVAAHRLYHVAPDPVWAHRLYNLRSGDERWVDTGQYSCNLFAFGMVYLPRQLVRRFLLDEAPERGRPAHVKPGEYGDKRFTDQTFSMWCAKQDMWPLIDWTVRPVHLHYQLTAEPPGR